MKKRFWAGVCAIIIMSIMFLTSCAVYVPPAHVHVSPPRGCCNIWAPGHYNHVGIWVPGYWRCR